MSNVKNTKEFIYTYKFNSIFTKIFVYIVLFSIIILFTFGIFVTKISTKNLIEENKATQINFVRQAVNSVDLGLEHIAMTMNSTFFNKNVIPSVIAPKNCSYEQKIALTRQLDDVVNSSAIIEKASLYIGLTNQVFSDSGAVSKLSDFKYENIIASFMKEGQKNILKSDKKYITYLKIIDNELFAFQKFPQSSDTYTGILMFKLNADELFKTAFTYTEDAESKISVYTSDNIKLLKASDKNISKNISENAVNDSGYFTYKNDDGEEQTVFYSKSDISSWIFAYPLPSSQLKPSIKSIFTVLIPFSITIFLLCLVCAFYISTKAYTPINNLIQNISDNQFEDNVKKAKDEIDFFSITYEDIKSRQNIYDEMLKNIAPSISERIMTLCIKGTPPTAHTIRTNLESIGIAYRLDDKYIVMIIEMQAKEINQVIEEEIFVARMTEHFQKIKEDGYDITILRIIENQLSVVFRFSAEITEFVVKSSLIDIKHQLLKKSDSLNYPPIKIGIGRVYSHIFDIYYSYADGLEDIKYSSDKQEINMIQEKNESAIPQNETTLYNEEYFIRRLSHIEEKLDCQDYYSAQELCERIVKELTENLSDMLKIKNICLFISEKLIEKLLDYKISINNPITKAIPSLEKELSFCHTKEDIYTFVTIYYTELILLFETYENKAKHKYILRAKEIIREDFRDINLSQQIVAEKVGIHPSYLSRLFKDNLGTNFLDYLHEYRVERAKEMIENTDIPVKKIGYEVGFHSMSTFFRVFKNFTDISPGQYREIHKK